MPTSLPRTQNPSAPSRRRSRVRVEGDPASDHVAWFVAGLERELLRHGHATCQDGEEPNLVLNLTSADRPRPYRRRAQGSFVVSIVEVPEHPDDVLRTAYPLLVRSLSNLLVFITRPDEEEPRIHFVTLEQGYYTVRSADGSEAGLFREAYSRLAPLASSRLVINNEFEADLEPELAEGNARTDALAAAGRRLDAMHLLPTPFPMDQLLDQRDLAHVHKLFGLGGLSYGNLSVREDETRFWMTARGVDKGKLKEVGRDMLLIKGFDPQHSAMRISVPAGMEPRHASVDAVEHYMLYSRHPAIGAIIHIHAWMEGIRSTRTNYPCGTAELAREVADLAEAEPDPARAVIGLRNHGLTITGTGLDDIFDRIEGRILPQVPME